MGLLDSVIGDVLGGAGGNASPLAGVLTGMLGGGNQAGQAGGQQAGGFGGIGGAGGIGNLVSMFEEAGLGHIAQSWVSNGPNQPVSPDQLQNVFGQDQVQNMASQAGMQPGDFLSQLCQHLPNVVHAATPNGQLPDGTEQSI